MSVGNVAALVICALMLLMSGLMYSIVAQQREDDRLHFLDLHRGLAARISALESEPKVEEEQPEVAVDLDTGVAIVSRKAEVEPEVQTKVEDSTVEIAVAIDDEWQRQQDEFYREAMAQIRGYQHQEGKP